MSPQVLQLPEESCRSYQQVPLYCQHTGMSESHEMAQGQLIHMDETMIRLLPSLTVSIKDS